MQPIQVRRLLRCLSLLAMLARLKVNLNGLTFSSRYLLPLPLALLFSSSVVANPHFVAQRVITLTPHITELAYSAGLGDKIIAVSANSDYPSVAQHKEVVANYQSIKLERILALQPDLVIAWSYSANQKELAQLQQFGINVYYSSINNLDDIATNIRQLSQWASDPSIGQKNADYFQKQLNSYRKTNQNKAKVRYFYQLSNQPLMSASSPNWPTPIFNLCGGKNSLDTKTSDKDDPTNRRSARSAPYPIINPEQLLNSPPQLIFTTNSRASVHDLWQSWPQASAQRPTIVQLNADWLARPTMRSLDAIKQVCSAFDRERKIAQ